jgi:hypothetical protein
MGAKRLALLFVLILLLGVTGAQGQAIQGCQNPDGTGCVYFGGIFGGSCVPPRVVVLACPAGPTPTPTVTPTPTPTPTATVTPVAVTQVPITFPSQTFLYAPECWVWMPPTTVEGNAPTLQYVCTPTAGDRIELYTSSDGRKWTDGGPIQTALCGTWEDDYNEHGAQAVGYCTGISNMVVTRLRSNSRWVVAYTAGKDPNSAGSGGVGMASGIIDLKSLTRYVGNPVFTSPAGWSNAMRLLRVNIGWQAVGSLQSIVPVAWLYLQDEDGHTYRAPVMDGIGYTGGLIARPGLDGYSPLGWDADGCWGIVGRDWTDDAGFGTIDIYSHGDCDTTRGTLLTTITADWLGHKGIAGVAIIERSPEGGILAGPTLLVTCWDSWASVTPPQAVQIGTPLNMAPNPDLWAGWGLLP